MTRQTLCEGLRIGDNFQVILPGGSTKFYKVLNRDQVFYRNITFDEVAALGGAQDYTEITDLNPPANEVIQICKIKIDSNVQLQLKQPAPVNRWGTNRTPQGGPMPLNAELDLWATKNYPPQIRIVNNTTAAVTPILKLLGWRYLIKTLTTKPDVYTIVSVTGVGGGL